MIAPASAPSTRDRDLAPSPREGAAFAREAAARAAGRPGVDIAVVTLPAPLAGPEALLEANPDAPAWLWAPPRGPAFAGVGVAAEITASGAGRFFGLQREARRLWERVCEIRHPAAAAPPARLFGGLAFAAGAADEPPWSDFGDAAFALPSLCYGRDGERAWLSAAAPPGLAATPAWTDRIARTLAQLAGAAGLAAPTPAAGPPPRVREQELSLWRREVDAIRAAISRGEVEKIVAARRSVVELGRPLADTALIARLAERHPSCFRFAVRRRGATRAGATFAGATPERLVAVRGAEVATEALAGSIAADPADARGGEQARRLLASRKDRGEQALVVDAITAALAPLCEHIDVPAEPKIRTLRHVLHLETPIAARLARPTHILEVAAALHPTPAVGGVPTRSALDWIAAREPAPRGWYAGPIGWFDAAGDGELAVAIRSGLLAGDTAYVYAGAGIVDGSDADAEYAETGLKQRPLLDVLEAG